jgi:hypothetical protein
MIVYGTYRYIYHSVFILCFHLGLFIYINDIEKSVVPLVSSLPCMLHLC